MMEKRTVSILKWIGFSVVGLALIFGMLTGLSSCSLHRAYAALEADGRPMKAEQVIPPYIPDTDNAALIYKAVVLQLKAEKAGKQDLLTQMGELAAKIVEEKASGAEMDQLRALLKRDGAERALVMLKEGTTKPGYRYDLDYSQGANMLLPHLSPLRSLTRILCAAARIEARDGQVASAWETTITALRFADTLRSEPVLVSQLVRIAQFSITADTIKALAVDSSPTGTQNREIQDQLKSFEDMTLFVNALDGERLLLGEWAFNFQCSIIGGSAELLAEHHFSTTLLKARVLRSLFRYDHAVYLRFMRIMTENATQPYSVGDAEMGERVFSKVPKYCLLTRMLAPALSTLKGRYVAMAAKARVTRVGLSALQYRQEHGVFPSDLDAMNAADLIDPFSGKPLIYHTAPTGFVVYSVGLNMVDDGGKVEKDPELGDIVWRYPGKE